MPTDDEIKKKAEQKQLDDDVEQVQSLLKSENDKEDQLF